MRDLRSPALLYLKGGLFLLLGSAAAAILLLDSPTLRTAGLLALAIWGFSRAYYFAFYVVEHYIDPGFRYAGLLDFARHAVRKWRGGRRP